MKESQKFYKVISTISLIAISFFWVPPVSAASLTTLSDTLTNVTKSANADHVVQFTTPTGVSASGTIVITIPSGFTMGSGIDYTDVDLKDDGVDVTIAASPTGTTWGAAFGGTGSRTLTLLTVAL